MSYLVKCEDGKHVAFVSAKTVKELFIAVDEVTDPYSCEYIKCKAPEAVFFKIGEDDAHTVTDIPTSIHEVIEDIKYKAYGFKWKTFTRADSWVHQ